MRQRYETDIESLMREALEKEGIDFAQEFPFRCKYGYRLDFAIPDLKIAIECDGEHWHKKNNHKDRKRDWFMIKRGWKILRFRGNKIKNDIHSCIASVKKEVERRRQENGR